MPKKTKWCVRVALLPEHQFGLLIEQLRYMGFVKVHSDTSIDFHCPHGLDSEIWARQNSERMRSFGFNAVKAPEDFNG